MHRLERSGLRPGWRVAHTVDPRHVDVACLDFGPHSSGDLVLGMSATLWPDSDELLLIVETAAELAVFLRAGFGRLDSDHLQIPWNDLAAVSRMDGRIALVVGARQIGAATMPNASWYEAASCLVGVMAPAPRFDDSPVAARFLDALDEGHAAVSEVAIYDLVNGSI